MKGEAFLPGIAEVNFFVRFYRRLEAAKLIERDRKSRAGRTKIVLGLILVSVSLLPATGNAGTEEFAFPASTEVTTSCPSRRRSVTTCSATFSFE
jgi:hypothetical protein